MPIPFQDAVLPGNLKPSNGINPVIGRGSLITFNYQFQKHDPYPLVLVTDPSYKDVYCRGINLHYLTFPVIKRLMFPAPGQSICGNPNCTYQYIKGNDYIVSAFRQYKRNGMLMIKKLDCDFIVNALSISRSFDPNEVEAIRKSVREQINRLTNPQAAASEEMPI